MDKKISKISELAINGGVPVRAEPMPQRSLIGEAEKMAVMEVFDEAIASGEAIGYNGKYEKQYEKDFVSFMGSGFADGVNSGTNGIYVALGALQLDVLSEVIVPSITDAGGVMPVVLMGCVPIFADTEPHSYNISVKEIEPMITERTRAIIVAHIGGELADLDPIMDLAMANNLYVIEDCSQAHGAIYKNRLAGKTGDISVFSTMYTKHYCTGGQGGVVFTKSEDIHWRVKRFSDRGKPFNIPGTIAGVDNVVAGLNCNLSDLSAAIGSVQLKKLPSNLKKRRYIGDAVKDGLHICRAVSMGSQIPDTKPSYWFLRLKLDLDALVVSKEQFCSALKGEGIPCSSSYRYIPCENPWFKNKVVFGKSGFPWNCSDYKGARTPVFNINNAIQVTDSHFNINIHENYSQKEIDDILNAIIKVENAYLR